MTQPGERERRSEIVAALRDGQLSTILFRNAADLLEADGVELAALRDALKGLSGMYTHAWDLADGSGLIMPTDSIPRFDAAHAAARIALGCPLLGDEDDHPSIPDDSVAAIVTELHEASEDAVELANVTGISHLGERSMIAGANDIMDMPKIPSRHNIGDIVIFQPDISLIDFIAMKLNGGLRSKIVGISFHRGKVTYDIAVSTPDGFYEAVPLRNVDSVMVGELPKLKSVK